MAQPKRKIIKKTYKTEPKQRRVRQRPKYGSSKLEDRFASEFLDKLGVTYERQFEAKDIKRFYDFKIGNILIEVDGDYWHGKDLVYEDKNRMQKHSEWVDEVKNEWAISHGYLLYRVWESDINNDGAKVMSELKEILKIDEKRNNKKKRH